MNRVVGGRIFPFGNNTPKIKTAKPAGMAGLFNLLERRNTLLKDTITILVDILQPNLKEAP